MSVQSILEVMHENVKLHKRDRKNTEAMQEFYEGYEKAIKNLKKIHEEKSQFTIMGYITAIQEFAEKIEK